MDQFDVPYRVNQHVFKALFTLQPKKAGFVSTIDITEQVKMQMRDCNDEPESDDVIRASLSNLTKMGILACTGSMDYALQHTMNLNTDLLNVVPEPEPKKKKTQTQPKKSMKSMKLKTKSMKAKIRCSKVNNCTKSLMCLDCVQALQNFSEAYTSLKPKNDANDAKEESVTSSASTEYFDDTSESF